MTAPVALVDTAVFAYALGAAHDLKAPCQHVVAEAGTRRLQLHASVEMVQELLFHRMRRVSRAQAMRQAQDAAELCTLHDFDKEILDRSMQLIGVHDSLRGRDAVHAATALAGGLAVIISPDTAFADVPGLRRVDPADVDAELLG